MKNGSVRVNPDDLWRAAAMLDSAATKTTYAGGLIDMGHSDSGPFGISAEAQQLCDRWNAAVATRVAEANELATQIHELADDLRQAAADYQDRDQSNKTSIEKSGN